MKAHFIVALLIVSGCSVDGEELFDEYGSPYNAEVCPASETSHDGHTCSTSDDCFWSQCASSECVKGTCRSAAHETGSICFVTGRSEVGTCNLCSCDPLPIECTKDKDCATGAECENAWCNDGVCDVGTDTGMRCGKGGMCVDGTCIEL